MMSQQTSAFCDAPLAKPTGLVGQGKSRLERLIDGLVGLDTAGRAQDDQKSLAARHSKYPAPVGAARSTMPSPSHRVRYNFFRRLSERQIEARDSIERGPLTLCVRLTHAAENHKGLVRTLRDRLAETAGSGPASSSREPDLADLLRAAIRLQEGRSTPVAMRGLLLVWRVR